jgi:hypothetical protein
VAAELIQMCILIIDLSMLFWNSSLKNKKIDLGICTRAVQLLSISTLVILPNFKEILNADKKNTLASCIIGLTSIFRTKIHIKNNSKINVSTTLKFSALQALLLMFFIPIIKAKDFILSFHFQKKLLLNCIEKYLNRIRVGLFSLIQEKLSIKVISVLIKLVGVVVGITGYKWMLGTENKLIINDDFCNYKSSFFRSLIAVLETEILILLFDDFNRKQVSKPSKSKKDYMLESFENTNKKLSLESKNMVETRQTVRSDLKKILGEEFNLRTFTNRPAYIISEKKNQEFAKIKSNERQEKYVKHTITTMLLLWEAIIDCLSDEDSLTNELYYANCRVKNLITEIISYIRFVIESPILMFKPSSLFFVLLRMLGKFTINFTFEFDIEIMHIFNRLLSIKCAERIIHILGTRFLVPTIHRIVIKNIQEGKSSSIIFEKLFISSLRAMLANYERNLTFKISHLIVELFEERLKYPDLLNVSLIKRSKTSKANHSNVDLIVSGIQKLCFFRKRFTTQIKIIDLPLLKSEIKFIESFGMATTYLLAVLTDTSSTNYWTHLMNNRFIHHRVIHCLRLLKSMIKSSKGSMGNLMSLTNSCLSTLNQTSLILFCNVSGSIKEARALGLNKVST